MSEPSHVEKIIASPTFTLIARMAILGASVFAPLVYNIANDVSKTVRGMEHTLIRMQATTEAQGGELARLRERMDRHHERLQILENTAIIHSERLRIESPQTQRRNP